MFKLEELGTRLPWDPVLKYPRFRTGFRNYCEISKSENSTVIDEARCFWPIFRRRRLCPSNTYNEGKGWGQIVAMIAERSPTIKLFDELRSQSSPHYWGCSLKQLASKRIEATNLHCANWFNWLCWTLISIKNIWSIDILNMHLNCHINPIL